jgi:hypothetical protein
MSLVGAGIGTFTAVDLDPELADRCVRVTKELGLVASGIDLRVTPADPSDVIRPMTRFQAQS